MGEPRSTVEPRTKAGRAFYDSVRIHNIAQRVRADDRHDAKWLAAILAIESEAAAPRPEPLDVDRLARAMEDVFPGWLDEAPGTAEAQAEMRSYARQLGEAYEFLRDSASPGAALAPSEPTDG